MTESILVEINNGQPIPLMWYIFFLLFFRILAIENIAKILTTGPRLDFAVQKQFGFWVLIGRLID